MKMKFQLLVELVTLISMSYSEYSNSEFSNIHQDSWFRRLFCIFVSIFKTINYFTNFLSFLLVNKHVCWRRLVWSTWLQNPVFFIWNGVSFHWFGEKFLVIMWTFSYRSSHPFWSCMGVLSVQVFGYNSFKLLVISMDVLTGKSSAVRLI